MFRFLSVDWRIDTLVGWTLLAITVILCTNRISKTVRSSVALANTQFESATLRLQENAQHESLILDQIIAIQGRQAAVVDMEQNNASRIRELERRFAGR